MLNKNNFFWKSCALTLGTIILILSCVERESNTTEECPEDIKMRLEQRLWRIARLNISDLNGGDDFGGVYEENEYSYWYFRNGNSYLLNYPYSLIQRYSHSYNCDTLIMNRGKQSKFLISFKEDSLLLTMGEFSNKTEYYIEDDLLDSSNLDLLLTENVNWNLFRKRYYFVSDTSRLEIKKFPPQVLDLSINNEDAFYFSRDTLFYTDSIGSYSFVFGSYDRMNSITLDYLYLDSQETIFYRDEPYNNFDTRK